MPFALPPMDLPLILTLNIDETSFAFFGDLRQQHFPPERNFLRAHVTLFHHLPGAEIARIEADLQSVCDEIDAFPLAFTKWRFLGKGLAMTIESAELLQLRAKLARVWKNWLNRQDNQKFQPHITVQNKVASDEARALFEKLAADWQPRTGFGEGLTLWHYVAPHWKLASEFSFRRLTK